MLKEDTYNYFWMQSPLFDKVRSDPRFQEIQNIYKEMYEYNLEKYGSVNF